MLRTRWVAVTFVTALWTAATDGASAQIGPAPAYLGFETTLDMTYTGNGESVRCTSPDVQGAFAETVLEAEIGATSTAFSRIPCGGVTISILRYLSTTELGVEGNMNVPVSADFHVVIEVFVHETGDAIVVHDRDVDLLITDGAALWPYTDRINDLPGVTFHNIVDTIDRRYRL